MTETTQGAEADLYAFVIGATVSQLREKRGWTQGELATRVGVGQPGISRIEHGQTSPDAHQLRAIAAAFDMTATELTAVIENAFARATAAAKNAVKGPPKDDWWVTALAVVGAVGLGGLAGFAAALALNDAEGHNNPRPGGGAPRPRSSSEKAGNKTPPHE